jgi:hypothetical protein
MVGAVTAAATGAGTRVPGPGSTVVVVGAPGVVPSLSRPYAFEWEKSE